MENITREELKKSNPWQKLIEEVKANDFRCLKENYSEDDDVEFLRGLSRDKNEDCRVHLEVLPGHYSGNILDASVVILASNPGYDEREKQNSFYTDRDLNKIRIKRLNFEYEYFLPKEQKWEDKSPYWYEKLAGFLTREKSNDRISRDEKFEKVSKGFALLQIFPYHSKKMCDKFVNVKKLKTVEYSRKLVLYAMKNEKTIIIARSRKLWFELVEELKTYKKLYILLNPRVPKIASENITKYYNGKKIMEELRSIVYDN